MRSYAKLVSIHDLLLQTKYFSKESGYFVPLLLMHYKNEQMFQIERYLICIVDTVCHEAYLLFFLYLCIVSLILDSSPTYIVLAFPYTSFVFSFLPFSSLSLSSSIFFFFFLIINLCLFVGGFLSMWLLGYTQRFNYSK